MSRKILEFNKSVQETLGMAQPNVTVASNQPVQLQQAMTQTKPKSKVLGGPR
jgi:hypothetical protein